MLLHTLHFWWLHIVLLRQGTAVVRNALLLGWCNKSVCIGFLIITSYRKLSFAKVRVRNRMRSVLFHAPGLYVALLPKARTCKHCTTLRVSGSLNFVPQMPLLPHPSPCPIIAPLSPFISSKCVLVGHQGSDLNHFFGSLLYLYTNRKFQFLYEIC